MKKKLLVFVGDTLNCDGDLEAFFETCSKNGATDLRMIFSYAWKYNSSTLFKELCKWTAGYKDNPSLPFYDLEQKNEPCWDRLKLILMWLEKYGMGLSGDFHCFFSIKQDKPAPWAKYYYPWLGNIQRHTNPRSEVPKIPDGFWSFHPEWLRLQKNYVKSIVELVSQYKVDATYRVMNEYDVIGWADQPERAINWYGWFTHIMLKAGIPKEKMIASNPIHPKQIMDEGLAQYLSLHGYARMKKIETFGVDPSQVILSGDGGFDGKGDADARGRRGLGIEDAKLLAEQINKCGYAGYEYLSRILYLNNNDRAYLPNFNPQPLKAMGEIFGTIPKPKPPEPKKIWVDICHITNIRANPFCLLVEKRQFIEGQEPKQFCILCKEKIEVKICLDNPKLVLSNPYCPRVATIKPDKDLSPTEVCKMHKEKTCYQKFIEDRPVNKWQVGEYIKCILRTIKTKLPKIEI